MFFQSHEQYLKGVNLRKHCTIYQLVSRLPDILNIQGSESQRLAAYRVLTKLLSLMCGNAVVRQTREE